MGLACSLGRPLQNPMEILWPRVPPWASLWESYGNLMWGLGCSLGRPLQNPVDSLWAAKGAPKGALYRIPWTSYGRLRVLHGSLWRILWKSYGVPRVLPKAPSGESNGNHTGGLGCSPKAPSGESYGNPKGA